MDHEGEIEPFSDADGSGSQSTGSLDGGLGGKSGQDLARKAMEHDDESRGSGAESASSDERREMADGEGPSAEEDELPSIYIASSLRNSTEHHMDGRFPPVEQPVIKYPLHF